MIDQTGSNIKKILQLSKEQLLNQLLNVFLPERFGNLHDKAVEKFLKVGKSEKLGKEVEGFVLNEEHDIVPLKMQTHIFLNVSSFELKFISKVQPNSDFSKGQF